MSEVTLVPNHKFWDFDSIKISQTIVVILIKPCCQCLEWALSSDIIHEDYGAHIPVIMNHHAFAKSLLTSCIPDLKLLITEKIEIINVKYNIKDCERSLATEKWLHNTWYVSDTLYSQSVCCHVNIKKKTCNMISMRSDNPWPSEHGSSTVLHLTAWRPFRDQQVRSSSKSGNQQINNLCPGCFIKGNIYEETSKDYSTMLKIVKDGHGKLTAWRSVCFQMIDIILSHIRQSLFPLCILYKVCIPAFCTQWAVCILQSTFCTDHVE